MSEGDLIQIISSIPTYIGEISNSNLPNDVSINNLDLLGDLSFSGDSGNDGDIIVKSSGVQTWVSPGTLVIPSTFAVFTTGTPYNPPTTLDIFELQSNPFANAAFTLNVDGSVTINSDGVYEIDCFVSGNLSDSATDFTFYISQISPTINFVSQRTERLQAATLNLSANISFFAVGTFTAGDVIALRTERTAGTGTYNNVSMNFIVKKLS